MPLHWIHLSVQPTGALRYL